jgi:hypothetical protein
MNGDRMKLARLPERRGESFTAAVATESSGSMAIASTPSIVRTILQLAHPRCLKAIEWFCELEALKLSPRHKP